METSINVQIAYNEKEIKKALSFYILRICDIRTYALITYPVLIAAIILSLIFSDNALLPLVFFICGVLLFCFYYQLPTESYLKFYKKRKGGLYRFSDDKICIIGEEMQSECLWSVFKKAYEIPSAFLLIDDNKFVYVFPKICFGDMLIIEQMRNLLTIRVPKFKKYK